MALAQPITARSGVWRRSARRWRRSPRSLKVGTGILLVHLLIAMTGPWAPYGLSQMGTGIPLSGMSPNILSASISSAATSSAASSTALTS